MELHRLQFALPPAVDEVLEDIVSSCDEDGRPVSRSEVIGTLVWQARDRDGSMAIKVERYRRAMKGLTQPIPKIRRRGRQRR